MLSTLAPDPFAAGTARAARAVQAALVTAVTVTAVLASSCSSSSSEEPPEVTQFVSEVIVTEIVDAPENARDAQGAAPADGVAGVPAATGPVSGGSFGGLDVGPTGDGSGAISPNGKMISYCVIGCYTYSGGAIYTDATSATNDPVCDRLRDEFYAANPWICPSGQGATYDPSRCPGGEGRSPYDPDLWGGGNGMPNPI